MVKIWSMKCRVALVMKECNVYYKALVKYIMKVNNLPVARARHESSSSRLSPCGGRRLHMRVTCSPSVWVVAERSTPRSPGTCPGACPSWVPPGTLRQKSPRPPSCPQSPLGWLGELVALWLPGWVSTTVDLALWSPPPASAFCCCWVVRSDLGHFCGSYCYHCWVWMFLFCCSGHCFSDFWRVPLKFLRTEHCWCPLHPPQNSSLHLYAVHPSCHPHSVNNVCQNDSHH